MIDEFLANEDAKFWISVKDIHTEANLVRLLLGQEPVVTKL